MIVKMKLTELIYSGRAQSVVARVLTRRIMFAAGDSRLYTILDH
jgi:hypothetical protein